MNEVQEAVLQKELKTIEAVVEKIMPAMIDLLKGLVIEVCKTNPAKGEQALEQLLAHGDKLAQMPLSNENIDAFTRIANKHGIDFSLKADETKTPPEITVHYKAKDVDAVTKVFSEYTAKVLENQHEKPKEKSKEKPKEKTSFKERAAKAKKRVAEQKIDTVKNKKRGEQEL